MTSILSRLSEIVRLQSQILALLRGDTRLGPFLHDCVERGDGFKTKAGDLYIHYLRWAFANDALPISTRAFGEAIRAAGIQAKRGGGGIWYHGIRPSPPTELNPAPWRACEAREGRIYQAARAVAN